MAEHVDGAGSPWQAWGWWAADAVARARQRLVDWLRPGRVLAVLGLAVAAVVALVVVGLGGPPVDPDLPMATTTPPALAADAGERGEQGDGELVAGGGSAPSDAAAVGPAGSVVGGEVVVHVAGAVGAPGVHRLPVGARVHDAVRAAGGPLPEADLDWLNLAAPLHDGTQIHVPVTGSPVNPAAPVGPGTATGSAPLAGGGGRVSLSTADAATLESLPGVGPATSAAIVAHRTTNGPFRSVEDLLDVRGIGPAKLDALRDLVVP